MNFDPAILAAAGLVLARNRRLAVSDTKRFHSLGGNPLTDQKIEQSLRTFAAQLQITRISSKITGMSHDLKTSPGNGSASQHFRTTPCDVIRKG